jgi:hypothetical protein
MFEGLDEIDWENLGVSHYGKNKQIPQDIRNLLSPNKDTRDESRASLMGWGQDYGDVYDTTSYIIPFIVEILSNPDAPGKEDLLEHLGAIIENVKNAVNISMPMMRRYVKTFDAFREGLDVFLSLLYNDDIKIRLGVVRLLQYWPDEHEIVVREFEKRFNLEEDVDVQLVLLKGLKTLLQSLHWDKLEVKIGYTAFFYKIMDSHSDNRFRVAAARAAVEIYEKYFNEKTELLPKAAEILADEFLRVSTSVDYLVWSEELEQAQALIRDLARLEALPLMELLSHPEITAVQAHLIAKGLISTAVMYTDNRYWTCWINNEHPDKRWDYVYQYPVIRNLKIDLEIESPRVRSLRAIIENQKFWEIPTNMFSFFFGLPDSRDELRNLLQQT